MGVEEEESSLSGYRAIARTSSHDTAPAAKAHPRIERNAPLVPVRARGKASVSRAIVHSPEGRQYWCRSSRGSSVVLMDEAAEAVTTVNRAVQ
jgi:hypothetical protein